MSIFFAPDPSAVKVGMISTGPNTRHAHLTDAPVLPRGQWWLNSELVVGGRRRNDQNGGLQRSMSIQSTAHISRRFHRMRYAILCGVAFVAIRASVAGAQTPPGTPPDDKDCKKAARIVEKGKPEKKEEWAFAVLPACAPATSVPAAVSAIAAMHAEQDTSALYHVWTPFFGVLDVAITNAFVDGIADRAATQEARVVAALGLVAQVTDATIVITYAAAAGSGGACQIGMWSATRTTIGNAPTQSTATSVLSRLGPLADDPTAPAAVRSAVLNQWS